MKELLADGACDQHIRSLATAVVLGPGSLWLNKVDNFPGGSDNPLRKIGVLLGCGGFWTACLGGGCCHFLNGPYTIQFVSWGSFAWILGIYITLTFAKLGERERLGSTPVEGIQLSFGLPQPQPNSFCRQLLAVECWLRVIIELNRDLLESAESDSEGVQIACPIHGASKEDPTFSSSQLDPVLLTRNQSASRCRTKSLSAPGSLHRTNLHQHRRARCRGPALS